MSEVINSLQSLVATVGLYQLLGIRQELGDCVVDMKQ